MYKASNDPRFYPPLMLVSMVKNGEFGASSGKGFYDWSNPRHPRARKLSRHIIDSAEDMTAQIINTNLDR
jgi:3-hydroxybutyryl-CoA dehydrogenase